LNDVVDLIHEMNQAFKRWVVRQSACGEREPSMPCGDSPAKDKGRQVTAGLARGMSPRLLLDTNKEL